MTPRWERREPRPLAGEGIRERREQGRRRRTPAEPRPRAHRWQGDRCLVCRLGRREVWTADAAGQAVLTIRWIMPGGRPIGLQVLSRLVDPARETPAGPSVPQLLRELRWIPEPPCPGSPEGWIPWGVTLLGLGPGDDHTGEGVLEALGLAPRAEVEETPAAVDAGLPQVG
ncbi:hypothetical protein K8Z61_09510 [Nocardioides sp. TRM66260-LWL]|uniref:hypothetical protein n=1 Tax=Nocardioides sp. TRM66260-LWL TaxID=2874478 RepID=UPI001CC4FA50|nr:hypothetical protein [Nocardioides sp. TRM66260-LWL]MBZ5734732.1 hypothetical protein [Nocardioides sp. TRM66260-LWL]